MIVIFSGGPADGLMKTVPTDKKEIRVATTELLTESKAAFYVVPEISKMPNGHTLGVAEFSGIRKSAISLVDITL